MNHQLERYIVADKAEMAKVRHQEEEILGAIRREQAEIEGDSRPPWEKEADTRQAAWESFQNFKNDENDKSDEQILEERVTVKHTQQDARRIIGNERRRRSEKQRNEGWGVCGLRALMTSTSCAHIFCTSCMDTWKSLHNSCPICRTAEPELCLC